MGKRGLCGVLARDVLMIQGVSMRPTIHTDNATPDTGQTPQRSLCSQPVFGGLYKEEETMKITARDVRKYLGHGDGNRRVRVSRDGHVTYYGSTDPADRSHDYWHEGGWTREYISRIEFEQAAR